LYAKRERITVNQISQSLKFESHNMCRCHVVMQWETFSLRTVWSHWMDLYYKWSEPHSAYTCRRNANCPKKHTTLDKKFTNNNGNCKTNLPVWFRGINSTVSITDYRSKLWVFSLFMASHKYLYDETKRRLETYIKVPWSHPVFMKALPRIFLFRSCELWNITSVCHVVLSCIDQHT
jgi:hypothetical protein